MQRQGLSIEAISQLTGWDSKTVRKYVIRPNALLRYGPQETQASKFDPFKPYLEEWIRARVWNRCTESRWCDRDPALANAKLVKVAQALARNLLREGVFSAGIFFKFFYVLLS